MKKLIYSLLLVMLVSCGKEDQPNFVIFLVDDLGWADVGFNNPESFYETPYLDQLASRGMVFTNAYASCPVCSPTRASIMTGKHPARVGITDWIPGSDPKNRKLLGPQDLHALPSSETTLAEALREEGYITCHLGKWHLGDEGSWPEDHGFDVNIGGWSVGSPGGKGYYSPYGNPRLEDGPDGEFLTQRLAREAIAFLDTIGERPFFMNFAFYQVHTPIQASRDHIAYFEKKRESIDYSDKIAMRSEHEGVTKLIQDNTQYASMIAAMDEGVGQVIEKMKETGLLENTYIFFSSDNGGLSTLANRGYPTSNLPLRAGKGWCYEGGIRVPFIVSGPEIKTGKTDVLAISMDLYPSILSLAHIPLKPEQHADGQVLPVLPGSTPLSPHILFWHYPHYHGSTWTPGAAIRSGNWKLIEFYEYDKIELYNLENDLEENHNLADSLPETVKELLEVLRMKQKETGAKMPILNTGNR